MGTVVTFQPDGTVGKDTYVSAGSKTSTYGNSTTIELGGSASVARTAYMFFDIVSQIPAGSTINSAVLSLYHYGGAYDRTFGVKAITTALASWSEMMDYYGQPTVETTAYAGTAQGTALNVWNSIDIKTLVQRWINGTLINNGFQLYKSDSYTSVTQYYSSDYTVDATLRPKLVIDYTEPFIPATKATATITAIAPTVEPQRSADILAPVATVLVISPSQRFSLCFLNEVSEWEEVSYNGTFTNPLNLGQINVGQETAPLKVALKTALGADQNTLLLIPGGDKPSDLAIAEDVNGQPGTWTDWGKPMTLNIVNKIGINTFFIKIRAQIGEKTNLTDKGISLIVNM